MLAIRKILVPTDFSPAAVHALDYAKDLAQPFSARVLLVHAIPPTAYPLLNVGQVGHFPDLREEIRKRVQQDLEQAVASVQNKVPVDIRILDGVPYAEILQCAANENADLIVMGTHGHTGIKHIVLGSTAERVVRLSTCPVLTVRGKEAAD
jgi:universal stress protein A